MWSAITKPLYEAQRKERGEKRAAKKQSALASDSSEPNAS